MLYGLAGITGLLFFVITSLNKQGTKGEQNLKQRNAVMLAEKGYLLEGYVIQSIHVPSSTECAQRCLVDQRCESLNYQSTCTVSGSMLCELNNSTQKKTPHNFLNDPEFTYYDLQKQVTLATSESSTPSDDGIYRSCSELKFKTNTASDGEYRLQHNYPSCNATTDVYCADMNNTEPLEYITLKAGSENNFSKKDYLGSSKSNLWPGTKTTFSKIRINPDLTVIRGDFRFATVTWFTLNQVRFYGYAAAADCSGSSCSSTKRGWFKMDLTGTGFKFSAPIYWQYAGYPNCQGTQPNSYSINAKKQIVSGNCGGFCGQCYAKDLKVELEEC